MGRMRAFQKKTMWGSERGSRGARIQTLRRFGERSTRRGISELGKNNSTSQEMIAEAKEEVSSLNDGDNGLRKNLNIR